MPDFFSPLTSQLDPRAGCGDPPGIQRQIGTEQGRFLDTPLQFTSFDEGLRIRYANTKARVIKLAESDAEGVVAEPRCQEGQTFSSAIGK